MKRYRSPKEIPVSQRQLAHYLGVSPSMLHMSESGRYMYHSLSTGSSKKKAGLVLAHQQAQKAGKPGPSALKRQETFNADAAKTIKRLELEADYALSKAKVFARRLAAMSAQEQADSQWLNTVDMMLATLPHNKESKNDRIWFNEQQAQVLQRLKKNGPLARAKLEMQVKMEKAKAAIIRMMIKKLKEEMK